MTQPVPDQEQPILHVGLMARIRAYFFAGILIVAPISITFYIAWIVINFIDAQVAKLLPADYTLDHYLPFPVPGLGLVVAFVLLTLIGWITAGLLGRLFLRISEAVLSRTPVVRSIYAWVKQIFETVFHERASPFREPVLIEFPRRGLWRIGFITGKTPGNTQQATPSGLVNVFLPGTPNVASGFLVLVPPEDIYVLDLTTEEALKLVVSAGIATPPDRLPSP